MTSLLIAASALLLLNPGQEGYATEKRSVPRTEVRLTVLFDNFTDDASLATGWGFAVLLETPEHTLLFDTGADGEILLANMRALGKDPASIDAVLISHAHSDHTGGLGALFEVGLRPPVYLLSAFPDQLQEEIGELVEVRFTEPGQEIIPGVLSTGEVGSQIPEQALILPTEDGVVILTGCAHPGAVEMAQRARELTDLPIHAIMGGFHLMQAQADDVQAVIGAFGQLGVVRAGPTHCSGETTMSLFLDAYGDDFIQLGVGADMTFRLVTGEG